jgi:hypothetical protein
MRVKRTGVVFVEKSGGRQYAVLGGDVWEAKARADGHRLADVEVDSFVYDEAARLYVVPARKGDRTARRIRADVFVSTYALRERRGPAEQRTIAPAEKVAPEEEIREEIRKAMLKDRAVAFFKKHPEVNAADVATLLGIPAPTASAWKAHQSRGTYEASCLT